MGADDVGPKEAGQEVLGELASNIEGLIQLGTWQLALAREMKAKVGTLTCQSAAGRAGKKSPSKKRAGRRKR